MTEEELKSELSSLRMLIETKIKKYNGNGIYKTLVTLMAGAIISGLAFWGLIGMHTINRAEAKEMIEELAPYIKDRRYILDSLAVLRNDIEKIKNTLNVR